MRGSHFNAGHLCSLAFQLSLESDDRYEVIEMSECIQRQQKKGNGEIYFSFREPCAWMWIS
jgi:hypothetical protein